MFPRPIIDNALNSFPRNSINISQIVNTILSFPYLYYLVRCKDMVGVCFSKPVPASVSSFLISILTIISKCAKEKMNWINTNGNIAFMKHTHCLGDFTVIQFIRNSMCFALSSFRRKAVSFTILFPNETCPQPTRSTYVGDNRPVLINSIFEVLLRPFVMNNRVPIKCVPHYNFAPYNVSIITYDGLVNNINEDFRYA